MKEIYKDYLFEKYILVSDEEKEEKLQLNTSGKARFNHYNRHFLMTRDDIIICDPEGEYFPLVQALKGQVIRLATDFKDYLNPMDIQLSHKTELMEDIRRVMPHIKDSDMEELAEQVLGKLQNMSDEEFAGVVLEPAEEIS